MRWIPVVLLFLVTAAACSGSPTSPADLEGGVLATFDVSGERFRVFVTNATTIGQLLALRDGASSASIPNGRIRRGGGDGDHNRPYGWHLDPEDISMADATIELCDGRPSYVRRRISTSSSTMSGDTARGTPCWCSCVTSGEGSETMERRAHRSAGDQKDRRSGDPGDKRSMMIITGTRISTSEDADHRTRRRSLRGRLQRDMIRGLRGCAWPGEPYIVMTAC